MSSSDCNCDDDPHEIDAATECGTNVDAACDDFENFFRARAHSSRRAVTSSASKCRDVSPAPLTAHRAISRKRSFSASASSSVRARGTLTPEQMHSITQPPTPTTQSPSESTAASDDASSDDSASVAAQIERIVSPCETPTAAAEAATTTTVTVTTSDSDSDDTALALRRSMLSNSMLFESSSLSDSSLSMPYASSGESGDAASSDSSDSDSDTPRHAAAADDDDVGAVVVAASERRHSPRKLSRSAASLRVIQRSASADSTPTSATARARTESLHAAARFLARDLATQICAATHLPRVVQHWSKMIDVGTSFTAVVATAATLSYTEIIQRTLQTFAECRIDLRITEHDVRLFEDTSTTPTAAYVIPISLLSPRGAKCAAALVVNWRGLFTRNYSSDHVGFSVPSFSEFLFNDVFDEAFDRHALVKCYVDEMAAFAVRRSIWLYLSPSLDAIVTNLIVQTHDTIRRHGSHTLDGHPRHISAHDVTEAARLRRVLEAYGYLRAYVLDKRTLVRAELRCAAEDELRDALLAGESVRGEM